MFQGPARSNGSALNLARYVFAAGISTFSRSLLRWLACEVTADLLEELGIDMLKIIRHDFRPVLGWRLHAPVVFALC